MGIGTAARPHQSYNAECDMVRKFMELHQNPGEDNPVTWQQLKEWHPPEFPPGTPSIERFTVNDWEFFIYEEEPETQFQVFRECGLTRILDYPLTAIRNIAAEDSNKLVAVIAPVVGITDVRPDWTILKYKCNNCNMVFETRKSNGYKPPKQCARMDGDNMAGCGQTGTFDPMFETDGDKAVNMQGIQLQEENLLILGVWTGKRHDMWRVEEGQKVYALGLVRFEVILQNRPSNRPEIRKHIELLHIEPILDNDVTLTDADKRRFEEMAKKDPEALYDLVLDSFAPHIHGNREQKEVCIYTLASENTKRPINSLLGGPSGRGKSRKLEYCAAVSTSGTYQTFGSATAVGLTASVQQDKATGMNVRRKGIFGIYKFVAITELQSIQEDKSLKVNLNDALERKKVAIAKAGVNETFDAACACLFDTNNFDGRWDYGESLAYNLQYLAPNIAAFLSRMDLVSIVSQEITEEEDDNIAGLNFRTYAESDEPINLHLEDWEEDGKERWGFITLKKFFLYITNLPEPKVDASLEQYYVQKYKEVKKHDYQSLVDGRYHPSVMRLTKVRARMLCKPIADKRDIDEAMRLLNRSKNIIVAVNLIDPENAEKDGNPMQGVPRKSVATAFFSEEEELRASIDDILKETDRDTFMLSTLQVDMVEKLKLPNWNKTKVKNVVNRWAFHTNQLREVGAPGSQEFAPTKPKQRTMEDS